MKEPEFSQEECKALLKLRGSEKMKAEFIATTNPYKLKFHWNNIGVEMRKLNPKFPERSDMSLSSKWKNLKAKYSKILSECHNKTGLGVEDVAEIKEKTGYWMELEAAFGDDDSLDPAGIRDTDEVVHDLNDLSNIATSSSSGNQVQSSGDQVQSSVDQVPNSGDKVKMGKRDSRIVIAESVNKLTEVLKVSHHDKQKRHDDKMKLEQDKIQAKKAKAMTKSIALLKDTPELLAQFLSNLK